eukprot:6214373-Pleurochrysis_carterae.AAC.2
MVPTAKDREIALLSAKIALFALSYAYAGPVPKNVTEYSAFEAYVTGNKLTTRTGAQGSSPRWLA